MAKQVKFNAKTGNKQSMEGEGTQVQISFSMTQLFLATLAVFTVYGLVVLGLAALL